MRENFNLSVLLEINHPSNEKAFSQNAFYLAVGNPPQAGALQCEDTGGFLLQMKGHMSYHLRTIRWRKLPSLRVNGLCYA